MTTKDLVLELWLKLGESLERLKLRAVEDNVLHLFWAARLLRDVENKLEDEKFDWAVVRLDTLSLDILDIYDAEDLKRTTEDVQRFRKEVGALVTLIEKGSNADTLVTLMHHQKAFVESTRQLRDLDFVVRPVITGRWSSKEGAVAQAIPRCEHGTPDACGQCLREVTRPKEGFTFIEPPSSPAEAQIFGELRTEERCDECGRPGTEHLSERPKHLRQKWMSQNFERIYGVGIPCGEIPAGGKNNPTAKCVSCLKVGAYRICDKCEKAVCLQCYRPTKAGSAALCPGCC